MAVIISNTTESNRPIIPVRLLYLHLMSFPTATSALTAWMSARGMGSYPIRAKVMSEAYHNAGATRKGTIATRHVHLVCGPRVLSEATIVYRAYLLPDELRSQLHSTDLPFGAVVESLGPSRRTTFARAMLAQNTLTSDDTVRAFTPILELHATVLTANHGPIARVHEVYGADLLLNMTAAHQPAHALSRDGTLAEI
jgi:hypothetical protein